jgi:hypothetical protein
VLYAYDGYETSYDLEEYDVTTAGFQLVTDAQEVIVAAAQITSQGGWIFATNGQVVNASTAQAVGRYDAGGPVWADSNGADVWFLEDTPALVDFDRETFVVKGSIALPAGLASGILGPVLGVAPGTIAFRMLGRVCVASVGD